jgi:hypothetical protein
MFWAFVLYCMYHRICDKIFTPPYTVCIMLFLDLTPLSHAAWISRVCADMLSVRVTPIQTKYLFKCIPFCVPSWLHGHTCTSFHAATVEASIKNQKNNFVANYKIKICSLNNMYTNLIRLKACEVQHLLKEKEMLFCFAVCTV